MGILINILLTNGYAIIAIILCGVMFWKVQKQFILLAKDIKHLEGISKYIYGLYQTHKVPLSLYYIVKY